VLTRIDRVQLAVPDRQVVAKQWEALLGAEFDGDDEVPALGARRSRFRLGDGWLEVLEPDGAGPVADAVARRGGHLFAAGVATADVAAVARRLGADLTAGQVFVDAGHGLRLVISAAEDLPAVGALDYFYEVTNLVADASAAIADIAERFGLEAAAFTPIKSREYGYEGSLTLFDPDRLHRFEVIHPDDAGKTMGRFFARHGESLYMCFAECGDLPAVEERARSLGAPCTPVGDHTLFLHPPGLGGTMVGLSRRTYAWSWSGHPERVEASS